DLAKIEKRAGRTRTIPRTQREGYLTDREAGKPPFMFPPTTLARWRDWCIYLGRRLDAYQDEETGVWYNSWDDLKIIALKRHERMLGPTDEHTDPNGTVWLPTGLVELRHD